MISLIIPTLNEGQYLRETLQALRSSLKKLPYEIIISDGRSTDDTLAIARRYADHVIVYKGEKRQTIANARNLGAGVATGDYFIFLDADVMIPDQEFFVKALNIFVKNEKLVGLCVSLSVLPELATRADGFFFGFLNVIHRFMNNVLHCGIASGEFQMIRASVFRDIGGYREDLVATEDNELFWRLARVGETWMEPTLRVLHSGRRAHKIGWPRLLSQWFLNSLSVLLFKKSASKVWEPIR